MNDIKENVIDTKEKNILNEQIIINYLNKLKNPFITLSVQDISRDLHIGINQAYELFKQSDFPAISVGKRKVISLPAYLLWKMSKKGRCIIWQKKAVAKDIYFLINNVIVGMHNIELMMYCLENYN